MMKTILNQGLFAGLLLVTVAANAQDYPAADFQPKVVYQDESIVKQAAAESAPVAAAPCASQAAASGGVVAEVDPKYPAANFQPKVLYSDTN
ncbi:MULTISPECIES: hypothetical protein [Methylomonas]|uniref:hypothetical protein n=1 Tax=Methylomonas TaxID=416 RepID=UPI001E56C2E2|nr:hypothetical protein [Methylomonas rhizoryzae]